MIHALSCRDNWKNVYFLKVAENKTKVILIHPKATPKRAKSAQSDLHMAPRSAQSLPKWPQSGANCLQSRPKVVQSRPKVVQSGPKWHQSRPKVVQGVPKVLQSEPKVDPKCHKVTPKWLQVIRMLQSAPQAASRALNNHVKPLKFIGKMSVFCKWTKTTPK